MQLAPIVVVGPGASGKDHLASQLKEKGYVRAVPCTTRPMRQGEVDGDAYHFLTLEEFKRRVAADEFAEWFVFGTDDWHYGTLLGDLEVSNLVVTNPQGLRKLDILDKVNDFTVVYLAIPESVRRARLEVRADADSVERRLQADAEDFHQFGLYDVVINDPEFTVEEVLESVKFARE